MLCHRIAIGVVLRFSMSMPRWRRPVSWGGYWGDPATIPAGFREWETNYDNYASGNPTGLVNVDLQVAVYLVNGSTATYQGLAGYYDPGNSPGVAHVASAVAALQYSAKNGPLNLSPLRPLCLRATMPSTTGTYMLGPRLLFNSPSRYHCNVAYWMSGASKKV